MKNLFVLVLFAVSFLTVETINAQATNLTEETWIINYYGAQTVVPPLSFNVPINLGNNCEEGIDIRSLDTTNCGTPFAAPASWTATCSTKTNIITFNGTFGAINLFCSALAQPTWGNPTFLIQ